MKKFDYYCYVAFKVTLILGCLLLFLNIMFIDTYSFIAYLSSSDRLKKLTTSNERLMTQNSQLELEIEKLKNDPLHIESIARKNYSMVKQGETVYIFRNN